MSDEDTNLPATQTSVDVFIEDPVEISRVSSQEEIVDSDLVHANNALALIYAFIPTIKSMSGVCKANEALFKAVENRRKILGKSYGPETNKAVAGVYEPLA